MASTSHAAGAVRSTSWSGRRVAGFAGIAFGVLFVAALALGSDGPVYDDSAAEVREFFVDNDARVHLTTWLGGLAFVFLFLPFAAGLRNVVASGERPDEPLWSRLSYTAAVLVVAIVMSGGAFWEVLSQGTAEDLSDETLVALARLDTVIFIGVLPWALALFAAAASLLVLRTGVLARWIGWLGAAGALLLVIGTLWLFTEDDQSVLAWFGFIGLPVIALWILAVSVAMIRSPERLVERPTG